jgi:hypothetical protein
VVSSIHTGARTHDRQSVRMGVWIDTDRVSTLKTTQTSSALRHMVQSEILLYASI